MHAFGLGLVRPLVQYGQGPGMNSGPGSGWRMMSPLGGGLLSVLALVAAVALIAWLLGHSGRGPRRQGETPLDILKKRYARGEIDRETFERMRNDLRD